MSNKGCSLFVNFCYTTMVIFYFQMLLKEPQWTGPPQLLVFQLRKGLRLGGSCRSGTSNVAATFTLRTRHAHPVLWLRCMYGLHTCVKLLRIRQDLGPCFTTDHLHVQHQGSLHSKSLHSVHIWSRKGCTKSFQRGGPQHSKLKYACLGMRCFSIHVHPISDFLPLAGHLFFCVPSGKSPKTDTEQFIFLLRDKKNHLTVTLMTIQTHRHRCTHTHITHRHRGSTRNLLYTHSCAQQDCGFLS